MDFRRDTMSTRLVIRDEVQPRNNLNPGLNS